MPGEDLQRFNPEEFPKLGAWPNSTYFNALSFEAENTANYKKNFGIAFSQEFMLVIDDEFHFQKEKGKKLQLLIEKNPAGFLKKWNAKCQKAIKKLKDYSDKNRHKPFEKYSNERLSREVERFHERMRETLGFLWTYLPTANAVEPYIVKKIPKINFQEIRPLRKVSAERLNEKLLKMRPGDEHSLKRLARAFGWYGLSLLRGKALTPADLMQLRKTATLPKKIKVSRNALLKELQLFLWLKFERIDAYNYALYCMRPLFTEALKRIGLHEKYWEVLLPKEIEYALKTGQGPEKLGERFTFKGLVKTPQGVRPLSIEEYHALKERFAFKPSNQETFTGQIACPGKAIGPVKVVHSLEDISKVNPGDILVAAETLVQYEPWMHKAHGMIIEMGGLLTHSAIFAREFKIPTLVGVPQATKALHDWDLVEVDARNGIVKRLNANPSPTR